MTKYNLLALDLDGTLLGSDGRISEENAFWIRKAHDSGVKVIFSTGRAIHSAGEHWDEIGLDTPMVMANGAEIWKGPGRLYKRLFMCRKDQERLLRLSSDNRFWYRAISGHRMVDSSDWDVKMNEEPWIKFSIQTKDRTDAEKIIKTVEAWGTLEVTRADWCYLEFTAKGATKEAGVREVCSILGIRMDEVMAIGDSPNDMLLLAAAGFGVAMGNAMDMVKEVADAITKPNNRDGVAHAIKCYLLG